MLVEQVSLWNLQLILALSDCHRRRKQTGYDNKSICPARCECNWRFYRVYSSRQDLMKLLQIWLVSSANMSRNFLMKTDLSGLYNFSLYECDYMALVIVELVRIHRGPDQPMP